MTGVEAEMTGTGRETGLGTGVYNISQLLNNIVIQVQVKIWETQEISKLQVRVKGEGGEKGEEEREKLTELE